MEISQTNYEIKAKMPFGLLTNKFSPKKGAPRKSPSLSNLNIDASTSRNEFGMDFGPIKIKLGSNEMLFDGGEWVSDAPGAVNTRETAMLKKQNKQLVEENNLLKIKIELLLDMLSKRTAELHLQENEIDQLRKNSRRR